MVVDSKAVIPLDVLGMIMTFVLMQPDSHTPPTSKFLGSLFKGEKLLVCNPFSENQAGFSEGGERFLYLLPRLFRVELLCTVKEGEYRFARTNVVRFENRTVRT